ncbi:MAG: tRNA 2-thiouridine(34) synthase MnmA [Oscillospiraceae bacterium]|nr:tRNA 2-thiouridine(34) synthase MnmA [Oscillospiraceae bacterium]
MSDTQTKSKALIAMSGGVDSSMAALLARQQGYDCIGCTMKLHTAAREDLPGSRSCCTLDDAEDARSVAYSLGMPFYVFNYTDDFRDRVICKFADCYLSGKTPNPCIDCNRYMKFEKLQERAAVLGCDKVVTGHYARIEQKDGLYQLKKALDPTKDQSYVLYSLTQQQLAHTLFPLGEYTKTEIRRMAAEHGFVTAHKPDSQDICFAPDGDYAKVIEEVSGRPCPPGNFVTLKGEILGRHKGIIHYTVGQRRGLGIAYAYPLYVIRICPEDNTVVVGPREALMTREARVREINWISGQAPDKPFTCQVKIRYRHPEQPVEVIPTGPDSALLRFPEDQRAVTPGQAAVFYEGDLVLGGGVLQ